MCWAGGPAGWFNWVCVACQVAAAACKSCRLAPQTCRAGDQLFRNAFRGTAKMYAADDQVLAWAKALLVSLAMSLICWQCLLALGCPAAAVLTSALTKGSSRGDALSSKQQWWCTLSCLRCRAAVRTGS